MRRPNGNSSSARQAGRSARCRSPQAKRAGGVDEKQRQLGDQALRHRFSIRLASSTLLLIPSLANRLARCTCTVFGDSPKAAAISRTSPCASQRDFALAAGQRIDLTRASCWAISGIR